MDLHAENFQRKANFVGVVRAFVRAAELPLLLLAKGGGRKLSFKRHLPTLVFFASKIRMLADARSPDVTYRLDGIFFRLCHNAYGLTVLSILTGSWSCRNRYRDLGRALQFYFSKHLRPLIAAAKAAIHHI